MKPLVVQEAVEAMQGRVLGRMANFSIVGVSTDSREVGPGQMFVALRGERYDGHAFVEEALSKGACAAVVSRVADLPEAVRQAGVLIVVDDTRQGLLRLGAYYRRQLAAQVIAVTGSNGKTTTKQMIHAVLSGERKGRCSPKSFNNEIGVPLTLLSAEGSDEYLVVELGSNCPGEIDRLARLVRPDMAVITGVAAAHLEGLGDIEGVAEEKMAVLGHVREGGFAAVNVDHAAVRRRLGWRAQGCTVVGFGLDERAELRATDVAADGWGVRFRINGRFEVRLKVPGRHNAVNALGAVAVGRRLGLEHEQIAERLASFVLPAMRLELSRVGGVTVINDAYNANPASVAAALEVLGQLGGAGRRVVVLGEMMELGEQSAGLHAEVGRQVGLGPVQLLVAIGEQASVLAEAAGQVGGGLRCVCFGDTEAAAARIGGLLQEGDVVLIKGSRALGLERLVGPIRDRFGSKTVGQSAG